jgi:two-component system sensor kinase FixL
MKVIGDGVKLKQALINLLENAAQHSPEDREITVTLEQEASKVWIKVKDQGTGIKPEIMSEVFKPFFTTRPRGAGLGLSIVKSIVETHGGDIHIYNNNPPPGLTVELYLPRSGEKG